MTFPVLRAFRNLLLIFKGYTKHRAFELIRDREEAMLALIQERLEADYPITDIARSEDVGQKRRKKVRQDPVNRSYHITSLLLNLEKDLESLCTLSGAQFAALQVEEEIAFGRALPELRIPHNTLKHIENAILPTLSFHFELRRRRTPAREHQWLLGPTEVYEVPEGSRRVLDDEVQCGWLAEAY